MGTQGKLWPRLRALQTTLAVHFATHQFFLTKRSGVVLRDDFARAELLELPGEREIHIRVNSKRLYAQ